MKPTSQDHDAGHFRTRNRKRVRTLDMSPIASVAHEPLTSPCRCGWPMLKSDRVCARCVREGRA